MASPHPNSIIIFVFQLVSTFLLLFSNSCTAADINAFRGSICVSPPAGGPVTFPWTASLNAVLSSLESNAIHGSSYSKSEAGSGSGKVYGLIQCRGDVSPTDCSECVRNASALAAAYCGGTNSGVIWQRWCFLRYSNTSFHDAWEKSSAFIPRNATSSNDSPAEAAKGASMMSRLAVEAPKAETKFAASETEEGLRGWKRYGVAQCSGNMRSSDCRDCLDNLLKTFGYSVGNISAWEMYGVGCFMQYDNYQFYFNYSSTSGSSQSNGGPPLAAGGVEQQPNTAKRCLGGWVTVVMAIFMTCL